jgi:hypothetical protein
MKKFSCFFVLFLIVGLASSALAAGTCIPTIYVSTTTQARVPDSVTVDTHLVCTADSGGTVSYALSMSGATGIPGGQNAPATMPYNLWGYYLYQVYRDVGSPVPSASYTTTITDTAGYALDLALLTGNGAAAGDQITAITSGSTVYPTLLSPPTVACTGLGSGGVVVFDLIWKAF